MEAAHGGRPEERRRFEVHDRTDGWEQKVMEGGACGALCNRALLPGEGEGDADGGGE